MESKSGVCTKNTYVKSAKNRGEILVPGVSLIKCKRLQAIVLHLIRGYLVIDSQSALCERLLVQL